MRGFSLLMAKELLEQVRTLRLVVVVGVLAVFGMTSPLLAKALPDIVKAAGGNVGIGITVPTPTVADAIGQLTKNLGQFGALIGILISMGAVAAEKERGTAGFVLTKPVGRSGFIVAKAAAIALLLGLGIGAGYVLAWIYTAILFEAVPIPEFVLSGIVIWISLLVFAAVTFLFSILARSSLVAGGIGFVTLLLIGIVAAIPGIGDWTPMGLWASATNLPLGTAVPALVGPAVLNVVLAVALVSFGALAFRRQEL